jgi:N-acetyl-gamma-glutamyl-phosphate reductase
MIMIEKAAIRIGIAGAAGYTGGELIRILLNHPGAEIVWLQSRSNAGKRIYEIHTDLLGETDLVFREADFANTDVLFLCMGHGESRRYIAENKIPANVRIIDLSQDFRLDEGWIYGLPELNRDAVLAGGKNIANPGCFATAIQLALLPLAAEKLISGEVHVSAITGSTGAGQSLSTSSHFSWRSNNISNYKAFEHQHLAEISRSLLLQDGQMHFIPYRGSFTRGILATIYTPVDHEATEIIRLFEDYYTGHPFTWISKHPIDVKQVVNTNKCFLHIEKHRERLMVTAVIDNLLKGASGQAVQNMNLLTGYPEKTGLNFKPSAF